MKTIILRLIILVSGYNIPAEDIQYRINQLNLPVKTEIRIYDFTKTNIDQDIPQYYALYACVNHDSPCLYILPPLHDDSGNRYLSGRSRPCSTYGTVRYVTGYEQSDLKVIVSEYVKTIGGKDNNTKPNIAASKLDLLDYVLLPETLKLIKRCI